MDGTALRLSSSEGAASGGRYSTGPDRGRSRGGHAAPPVVDLVAPDGMDLAQVLADWQTIRIRNALGVALRQTTRVRMARPRWMPRRLFRLLMRSIVIDVAEHEGRRILRTRTGDHRAPRR